MRNTIFILLFGAFSFLNAQVSRFVYEVEMRPNAQAPDEVKREEAFLDITDQKSVFQSANSLKRDSIMQRMRETRNFDRSAMGELSSVINYQVEKDLLAQSIGYKERIGRDQYEYIEDREMVWSIQPETQKIGDYTAQKAITKFGGRDWTAWFTSDVPLQDGPYKFSGLPGLIIKVEDASGSYSFDLKETKNIAKISSSQPNPMRGTVVKVKRADFVKQKNRFLKDPVAFMSSASNSGRGGFRGGARSIDPQRQRAMQERFKEELLNETNPIEKE